MLIAYVGSVEGWKAFKREVHPDDLKTFKWVKTTDDLAGRWFDGVIRGWQWEKYGEIYEILKTRSK